jgi:GrpB-like predicted nucleotidyltransferase (UPF0157 family)
MHEDEVARRALGSVSLVPPDPLWPRAFLRERDRLQPSLGPIARELQHYGSTAIPGLRAKPILDMMAPVASLDAADALAPSLASASYQPIDAGFFKRRFFRREPEQGTNLAFHLHLVVAPAWPIKNELILRDWLISRPDVAITYEELKLQLAAKYHDDMPRYTQEKTSFLRAAVNDARLSRGLPLEQDWLE